MKRYALFLLALILVAAAGIWWVASRPIPGRAPAAPGTAEVAKATPTGSPAVQPRTAGGPWEPVGPPVQPAPAPPPASALPLLRDPDKARDEIQALATGGDPAVAIVDVARYLRHEDELVRQEAVTGLLVLGQAAAAPYLEAAATELGSRPELAAEAEGMRETAKFLRANPEPSGFGGPRDASAEPLIRVRPEGEEPPAGRPSGPELP